MPLHIARNSIEDMPMMNTAPLGSEKKKTLVIYHYYEKDQSYIDNFLHFIRFGYTDLHDYIIVIAGQCGISLPQKENIKYVYTENKNNDYGGYVSVINSDIAIHAYGHFIFVNSSVRGPYVPLYAKKIWTEYFTDQLAVDVGIVGTTINILPEQSPYTAMYKKIYGGSGPYSHVQTMAYALSQAALLHLIELGFYDIKNVLEKDMVICNYEIRLSQLLIQCGLNMKCLLPEYNTIDYRLAHGEINHSSWNGDPNYAHAYFGRTVHPFEIMFVKTNRALVSFEYLDALSSSADAARTVSDTSVASAISFDRDATFWTLHRSSKAIYFETKELAHGDRQIIGIILKPIRVVARYFCGVINVFSSRIFSRD